MAKKQRWQWVVVIRSTITGAVDCVVGPFTTTQKAKAWVNKNDNQEAYYCTITPLVGPAGP